MNNSSNETYDFMLHPAVSEILHRLKPKAIQEWNSKQGEGGIDNSMLRLWRVNTSVTLYTKTVFMFWDADNACMINVRKDD